jgi:hypothetical protein
MIDINKLKLTDMNDFRLIPQLVEEMNTKFIKEEEKFISEKLFDLNIDKDILINQVQEIKRLNDILREYKELEEQGLLLKLPCKVGTTVWAIEKEDIGLGWNSEYVYCIKQEKFNATMVGFFGKDIFLTKEEAEQELKRMECAE